MSTDERMTIDEKREYLRTMHKRYVGASRKERGRLLDEMATVTGLHRKVLIRLMKGPLMRKIRRKQRGRTYGAEVDGALGAPSQTFFSLRLCVFALDVFPIRSRLPIQPKKRILGRSQSAQSKENTAQ